MDGHYTSSIRPRQSNSIEEGKTNFEHVRSSAFPFKQDDKSSVLLAIQQTRENEKREFVRLNELFASYIERVRFLEAQNQRLELEINHLQELSSSHVNKLKQTYENKLKQVRHIIENKIKDRQIIESKTKRFQEENKQMREIYEHLTSQHDNKKQKLELLEYDLHQNEANIELFRRRLIDLEDEQTNYRIESKKLISDIQSLTKDLDIETIARIKLENEKFHLENERNLLIDVHSYENDELKRMNLYEQHVQMNDMFQCQLSSVIRDIRNEYEQKISQLESWHRFQVSQAINHIQSQRIVQTNEQNEMKNLQTSYTNSKQDILTLREKNIDLENRIEQLQKLIQDQKYQNVQQTNEKDQEINYLRIRLQNLAEDYDELISMKSNLTSDITKYRQLLDGDNNRQGLKQIVSNITEQQIQDKISTTNLSTIDYRNCRLESQGVNKNYSTSHSYMPFHGFSSMKTESTIFERVYGYRRCQPTTIHMNSLWKPLQSFGNNRNYRTRNYFDNYERPVTPPRSDYTDAYVSAFSPKTTNTNYCYYYQTPLTMPYESVNKSFSTLNSTYSLNTVPNLISNDGLLLNSSKSQTLPYFDESQQVNPNIQKQSSTETYLQRIERPDTLSFQQNDNIDSLKIQNSSLIKSSNHHFPIQTKTEPTLSTNATQLFEHTINKYDSIINEITDILSTVSPINSTISSMSPSKCVLDFDFLSDDSPTIRNQHESNEMIDNEIERKSSPKTVEYASDISDIGEQSINEKNIYVTMEQSNLQGNVNISQQEVRNRVDDIMIDSTNLDKRSDMKSSTPPFDEISNSSDSITHQTHTSDFDESQYTSDISSSNRTSSNLNDHSMSLSDRISREHTNKSFSQKFSPFTETTIESSETRKCIHIENTDMSIFNCLRQTIKSPVTPLIERIQSIVSNRIDENDQNQEFHIQSNLMNENFLDHSEQSQNLLENENEILSITLDMPEDVLINVTDMIPIDGIQRDATSTIGTIVIRQLDHVMASITQLSTKYPSMENTNQVSFELKYETENIESNNMCIDTKLMIDLTNQTSILQNSILDDSIEIRSNNQDDIVKIVQNIIETVSSEMNENITFDSRKINKPFHSIDYLELSSTNTELDSSELIHNLQGHSIVRTESSSKFLCPPSNLSNSTSSLPITNSDCYVSYAIHRMNESSQDKLPIIPLNNDIPIDNSNINEILLFDLNRLPTRSIIKEDDLTEFDATENLTTYSDDIQLQTRDTSNESQQYIIDALNTDDDIDEEFEHNDLTDIQQFIDQMTNLNNSLSTNEEAYQRYDIVTTSSSNDSSSSSKQQTDDIYLIPGYPGLWRRSVHNDKQHSTIDYDADDERKSETKNQSIVQTETNSGKFPLLFDNQKHQILTTGIPLRPVTTDKLIETSNQFPYDRSESESFRTCLSTISKERKSIDANYKHYSNEQNEISSNESIFLIRQRERGVSLPISMKIDCDDIAFRLSNSTPLEAQLYLTTQPYISSSIHSEPIFHINTDSNSQTSSSSMNSSENDQQKLPSWLNTLNTMTTVTEKKDGQADCRITFLKSAKGPISITECHLHGDYVTIENMSQLKTIDLSNWTIRQENDSGEILIYTFPENYLLRANHSIKILSKTNKCERQNDDLLASSLSSWHIGPNIITSLINQEGKDRATLVKQTIFS